MAKSVLDKIVDFIFPPRKLVQVPISEEMLETHHVNKALAIENAELKGQMAKIISEQAQRRDSDKDKESEKEVKLVLNKKKNELYEKSIEKYFSLSKFFKRVTEDKKYKGDLYFTSFDRKSKLAQFGDIGFSANGDILLLDNKGTVIMKTSEIKDLFQSVGALENDARAKLIPLNLDSEGAFIPNVMMQDFPEMSNVGGKIKYMKARTKPLYDLLKDKQEQISDVYKDLEEAEALAIEREKAINKLQMENKMYQRMSEVSRAAYSSNLERMNAINSLHEELSKEVLQLRMLNAVTEDDAEVMQKTAESWRTTAEGESTKLQQQKAIDTTRQIRRELVDDRIAIQESTPPTPVQLPIKQGDFK